MASHPNILNNNQIKSRNRLAVLDLLKERGVMSRSELTRCLQCDGTTITNIIRSLQADDFVNSLGCKPESGRGRPKELISLNEDACSAIGISLTPRMLSGVVTNLGGNIISQERIHLEAGISNAVLTRRLKELTASLMLSRNSGRFAGIGIATFGVYSPEKGVVTRAEYFDAICGIHFEKIFQQEFGIVPEVIDGTTARGLAESWVRRPTMPSSFILLNVDIGIGCFLYVQSRPLQTSRGSYNEFGHTILNPDGDRCEVGHRGCLETYAAIPALERKVAALSGRDAVSFEDLLDGYRAGDTVVTGVVNESADWLGVATANLVNIFSPELIVLSGGTAQFAQTYLDRIEASVRRHAMPEFSDKIKFSFSAVVRDDPALGAALLKLNGLFAP